MKAPIVIITLAGLLSAAPLNAALPAQTAEAPLPSLAPMIKTVSPTVVGIATRGTVQQQRNPLFDDPFFRRFFEVPPESPAPRERPLAAGSGVVVDAKNGYIVTNSHVVANASKITVTLDNGTEVAAEVVGSDDGSDIALLQVKNARLTAIPLGDSTKLEVGDFVVAIGNPFGLEHTVTSGIVSALGRSGIGPNQDSYQDFIQTDASINPGNSGGALVNLRGELVGINAAILSGSGGNIGIGFAIPVNMVKSVMDQLAQYGEVKRGILGVRISTLTPDFAKAVGAPGDTQGALVAQVEKGSAAETAGIKVSDIITAVNGKTVHSDVELRNAIGLLRVGDKVKIGLLREGKPRTVTATITEATTKAAEAAGIHQGFDGADLADSDDGEGVLVRSVAPNSAAAQYGLRTNDVIYGVNRLRVRNVKELQEASKNAGSLVLNVRRGNSTLLILMR